MTIARLNSGVPFPHRRKTWGAAADNEQLDGSGLLRRGDLSADLRGQVYNALVNSMIEGSYCLSNSQPAELTSTNTKNEYWHQRIAAVDGRPTAEGPVPESFDGRLPDPEITAWEHDSPASPGHGVLVQSGLLRHCDESMGFNGSRRPFGNEVSGKGLRTLARKHAYQTSE